MVKLLIIADDFTGALDTGVQFSSGGIKTKVIVDNHLEVREDERNQVLVIDAETRHLSDTDAYRIIYDIVEAAEEAGIPYIYKKTDSALRGNIGSELTAALEASSAEVLPFIPAFPKMNRITSGGIHYIDGVPVSKSVFGQDPFEPVMKDSVKEIILAQRDALVTEVAESEKAKCSVPSGILVYDAVTDESLEETAFLLKKQNLCHLMAGCAGFATILPRLLGLHGEERREEYLSPRLLVVCGSVNPITRKQLAYGVKCGYPKINLIPEQKLNQDWWETPDGGKTIQSVKEAVEAGDCCIIDSNDPEGTNSTMEYAGEHQITLEEVRVRISQTLGMAAKKLLEQDIRTTFLVTGGDTLLGLMKQIGSNELMPVCEMAPGSVLTKLEWQGKTYHIITKSGGFGDEKLLEQIVKKLKNKVSAMQAADLHD